MRCGCRHLSSSVSITQLSGTITNSIYTKVIACWNCVSCNGVRMQRLDRTILFQLLMAAQEVHDGGASVMQLLLKDSSSRIHVC